MSEENISNMQRLIENTSQEDLGSVIAGVLEFLTARAVLDGSYYIMTDDEEAMTVIAVDKDVEIMRDALPEHFKSWDDEVTYPQDEEFITNSDPGDEQNEPTA